MGYRDIMLGADPEFVFALNGQLIPANQVATWDANQHTSCFGCDGHNATAEVRPCPAADPMVLVRNIRECLLYGIAKNPNILTMKLLGGAHKYGKSIGGHIHICTGQSKRLRENHEKLAQCLDNYISVPLGLIDSDEEFFTRVANRGNDGMYYGALYTWRDQPGPILEWRTLLSWLCSRQLTRAIFAITKTLVHEFQRHDIYTMVDLFPSESFISRNRKPLIKAHIGNGGPLIGAIKNMELYKQYSADIDWFYTRCLSEELLDTDRNILTEFGILTEEDDELASMMGEPFVEYWLAKTFDGGKVIMNQIDQHLLEMDVLPEPAINVDMEDEE